MISGVTLTIIMVVILFVLLIPGQWIFVALGVSGIAGIILGSGADYLTTVGTITWNTTNNFVLSAVPMFMFMGELIVQSGLSSNFYKGLMKWCRRIPGGLLHANVIACAFYSAISGSSVATAAGIGSIAVPETKKRGYPVRTIYGSIAASGTLGILIPPSTVLILYGSLTDQSVVKLFAASAIPGIVLTLMFIVYIFFNGVYLKKKRRIQHSRYGSRVAEHMAGHQGHSAYRHHHSGAAGLAVHRKGDSCRVGCSGNIHRTGIRLCVEGPFVEEDSGIGKEHIQVHSDDTDSDDFGVISDLCPFPVQRQQTPDDMGNRPRLYPAGYFNHHRLNISGTRLLHGRLVDDNADDSFAGAYMQGAGSRPYLVRSIHHSVGADRTGNAAYGSESVYGSGNRQRGKAERHNTRSNTFPHRHADICGIDDTVPSNDGMAA